MAQPIFHKLLDSNTEGPGSKLLHTLLLFTRKDEGEMTDLLEISKSVYFVNLCLDKSFVTLASTLIFTGIWSTLFAVMTNVGWEAVMLKYMALVKFKPRLCTKMFQHIAAVSTLTSNDFTYITMSTEINFPAS